MRKKQLQIQPLKVKDSLEAFSIRELQRRPLPHGCLYVPCIWRRAVDSAHCAWTKDDWGTLGTSRSQRVCQDSFVYFCSFSLVLLQCRNRIKFQNYRWVMWWGYEKEKEEVVGAILVCWATWRRRKRRRYLWRQYWQTSSTMWKPWRQRRRRERTVTKRSFRCSTSSFISCFCRK